MRVNEASFFGDGDLAHPVEQGAPMLSAFAVYQGREFESQAIRQVEIINQKNSKSALRALLPFR